MATLQILHGNMILVQIVVNLYHSFSFLTFTLPWEDMRKQM